MVWRLGIATKLTSLTRFALGFDLRGGAARMERAVGDLNDSWPSDEIYFRIRTKVGAFIPSGGLDRGDD